jgi:hypothetical protein
LGSENGRVVSESSVPITGPADGAVPGPVPVGGGPVGDGG